MAGGPARLQIISVLAAILALEASDLGTVSAVSGQLKGAFHLGNTQVGLLLAVVSFVGAAATLPMGALVDRFSRRVLLMVVVATWVLAEGVSGAATSFTFLLITRGVVGAVTAVAWPCVASLTGDFFPARDRAAIYGLIIAGELIGMGVGFFISGEASTLLNWHWSFYVMALPAIALVWVIWRFLPEPQRGTQNWISEGEEDAQAASRPASRQAGRQRQEKKQPSPDSGSASPQETVSQTGVRPREELVLREDPTRWSLWRVMRYLLRLPTYSLLIVASALAYYFLSGARAFAMIYITGHYHIARGVVSALVFVVGIGTLAGTIAGGRVSEHLLRKGKADARIIVAAVALALSVPILGVAIWTSSAMLGIGLLTIGAGVMSAAVAPIDAARLDIVHPRMWGRGEAGRMALRSTFEGGAPLLFGALSEWLGGGRSGQSGLMWTFLIMLIPMLVASLLGVTARKTYLRDVATAAASSRACKS